MLQQMVRAARLDRRLFTELIFDSEATATAVMLVSMVWAVVYVAAVVQGLRLSVLVLFRTVVFGLAGWIAVGLVTWVVGAKLFRGSAQPQTALRLTGFAYVALLLLAVEPLAPTIVPVLALVWFGSILVVATQVLFDLSLQNSVATVLLTFGGVALLGWLLRISLIPF